MKIASNHHFSTGLHSCCKGMSSECIRKAALDAERQNVQVIHCCTVVKYHERQGKDQRILVITELFMSFYKIKKTPVSDKKLYWTFLANLTQKDKMINFNFGDYQCNIESDEANIIRTKILAVLQRMHTYSELENLKITSYITRPYPSNGLGLYSRFKGWIYKNGLTKNTKLIDYVRTVFMMKRRELNLAQFSDSAPYSASAIDCIKASMFIESFSCILGEKNNPLPFLLELADLPSHLRHLKFVQKQTNDLVHFFDQLITKNYSLVKNFSFQNTNLSIDVLNSLLKLGKKLEIISLSFQNALDPKSVTFFQEKFFVPPITDSLRYLNLDNSQNLRIPIILPKLTNIIELSLANCKLEITTAMEFFGRSQFDNLTKLNLSMNNLTKSINDNIKIPRKLKIFYLDNITITAKEAGVSFFKFLMQQTWKDGIELSFARAKMDNSCWQSLLQYLSSVEASPLIKLVWDGNLVNQQLLDFIQKCYHLQILSISDCLNYHNPQMVQQFGNAIQSLPALNKLILIGSKKNNLLSTFEKIFPYLLAIKSLRILDVSGNYIGDHSIKLIEKLIQTNTSMYAINFDDSNIESLNLLTNLINIATFRPVPLLISWPQADIDRLKSTRNLKENEIVDFKRDLQKLSKEDIELIEIPDCSLPLEEPFEVFCMEHCLNFPEYYSEETVGSIKTDTSLDGDISMLSSIGNFYNSLDMASSMSSVIKKPYNTSEKRSSDFDDVFGSDVNTNDDLFASENSGDQFFMKQGKKPSTFNLIPPDELDNFDDIKPNVNKSPLDAFRDSSEENLPQSKAKANSPQKKSGLEAFEESSENFDAVPQQKKKSGLDAFKESSESEALPAMRPQNLMLNQFQEKPQQNDKPNLNAFMESSGSEELLQMKPPNKQLKNFKEPLGEEAPQVGHNPALAAFMEVSDSDKKKNKKSESSKKKNSIDAFKESSESEPDSLPQMKQPNKQLDNFKESSEDEAIPQVGTNPALAAFMEKPDSDKSKKKRKSEPAKKKNKLDSFKESSTSDSGSLPQMKPQNNQLLAFQESTGSEKPKKMKSSLDAFKESSENSEEETSPTDENNKESSEFDSIPKMKPTQMNLGTFKDSSENESQSNNSEKKETSSWDGSEPKPNKFLQQNDIEDSPSSGLDMLPPMKPVPLVLPNMGDSQEDNQEINSTILKPRLNSLAKDSHSSSSDEPKPSKKIDLDILKDSSSSSIEDNKQSKEGEEESSESSSFLGSKSLNSEILKIGNVDSPDPTPPPELHTSSILTPDRNFKRKISSFEPEFLLSQNDTNNDESELYARLPIQKITDGIKFNGLPPILKPEMPPPVLINHPFSLPKPEEIDVESVLHIYEYSDDSYSDYHYILDPNDEQLDSQAQDNKPFMSKVWEGRRRTIYNPANMNPIFKNPPQVVKCTKFPNRPPDFRGLAEPDITPPSSLKNSSETKEEPPINYVQADGIETNDNSTDDKPNWNSSSTSSDTKLNRIMKGDDEGSDIWNTDSKEEQQNPSDIQVSPINIDKKSFESDGDNEKQFSDIEEEKKEEKESNEAKSQNSELEFPSQDEKESNTIPKRSSVNDKFEGGPKDLSEGFADSSEEVQLYSLQQNEEKPIPKALNDWVPKKFASSSSVEEIEIVQKNESDSENNVKEAKVNSNKGKSEENESSDNEKPVFDVLKSSSSGELTEDIPNQEQKDLSKQLKKPISDQSNGSDKNKKSANEKNKESNTDQSSSSEMIKKTNKSSSASKSKSDKDSDIWKTSSEDYGAEETKNISSDEEINMKEKSNEVSLIKSQKDEKESQEEDKIDKMMNQEESLKENKEEEKSNEYQNEKDIWDTSSDDIKQTTEEIRSLEGNKSEEKGSNKEDKPNIWETSSEEVEAKEISKVENVKDKESENIEIKQQSEGHVSQEETPISEKHKEEISNDNNPITVADQKSEEEEEEVGNDEWKTSSSSSEKENNQIVDKPRSIEKEEKVEKPRKDEIDEKKENNMLKSESGAKKKDLSLLSDKPEPPKKSLNSSSIPKLNEERKFNSDSSEELEMVKQESDSNHSTKEEILSENSSDQSAKKKSLQDLFQPIPIPEDEPIPKLKKHKKVEFDKSINESSDDDSKKSMIDPKRQRRRSDISNDHSPLKKKDGEEKNRSRKRRLSKPDVFDEEEKELIRKSFQISTDDNEEDGEKKEMKMKSIRPNKSVNYLMINKKHKYRQSRNKSTDSDLLDDEVIPMKRSKHDFLEEAKINRRRKRSTDDENDDRKHSKKSSRTRRHDSTDEAYEEDGPTKKSKNEIPAKKHRYRDNDEENNVKKHRHEYDEDRPTKKSKNEYDDEDIPAKKHRYRDNDEENNVKKHINVTYDVVDEENPVKKHKFENDEEKIARKHKHDSGEEDRHKKMRKDRSDDDDRRDYSIKEITRRNRRGSVSQNNSDDDDESLIKKRRSLDISRTLALNSGNNSEEETSLKVHHHKRRGNSTHVTPNISSEEEIPLRKHHKKSKNGLIASSEQDIEDESKWTDDDEEREKRRQRITSMAHKGSQINVPVSILAQRNKLSHSSTNFGSIKKSNRISRSEGKFDKKVRLDITSSPSEEDPESPKRRMRPPIYQNMSPEKKIHTHKPVVISHKKSSSFSHSNEDPYIENYNMLKSESSESSSESDDQLKLLTTRSKSKNIDLVAFHKKNRPPLPMKISKIEEESDLSQADLHSSQIFQLNDDDEYNISTYYSNDSSSACISSQNSFSLIDNVERPRVTFVNNESFVYEPPNWDIFPMKILKKPHDKHVLKEKQEKFNLNNLLMNIPK